MMNSTLKYYLYFLFTALRFASGSDLEKFVRSNLVVDKYALVKAVFHRFPGSDKHMHSRLAFLSDKAGKTRVVALGDLFSQTLLKPVHSHFFAQLKKLYTDGTFDQDKQRLRVKEATANNRYCASIDMSSCTDRLPAVFQQLAMYWSGALDWKQSLA